MKYSNQNFVTVKFLNDSIPQQELLFTLNEVLNQMVKEGIISNLNIEAVFPECVDSKHKSVFVIYFNGLPTSVVEKLSNLPGVLRAYISSTRNLSN